MSSNRIMAEEPIEKKITRILLHKKMTVTAAESCTGGLVAGTLVNADGISEVFKERAFPRQHDYPGRHVRRVQACARREGRFHSGALGRDARDRGVDQSRNQGYDPLHSCRCSGRRRRLHRQRQAVPPPGAVRPVLLIERLIASLDVSTVRIGSPIRTVSFYSFCVGRPLRLRLLRDIPVCRFGKGHVSAGRYERVVFGCGPIL